MSVIGLGRKFIAAVLKTGQVSEWIKHGAMEHLFKNTETELFQFVQDHVQKYGALPDPETVTAHTKEELGEAKEPPDYYADLLYGRYVEFGLKEATLKAGEHLKADAKDPLAALATLSDAVFEMNFKRQQAKITDFQNASDIVMPAYKQKFQGLDGAGLTYAWSSIQNVSAGLFQGDLVSLVGRPGLGKTQILVKQGLHSWAVEKKRVMFVSMEMMNLLIHQRLAATYTKKKLSAITQATLSTVGFVQLQNGLSELKNAGHPLWVVDGNMTSTATDIVMLALMLKPDLVLLDGAYLLKHPWERDRYKRVSENVDILKKDLAKLAPVIATFQFKRSDTKKKKAAEDYDLDDIGYSDAIGQHSTCVLGLFDEESIETEARRRVRILKGRGGETGSFMINWDWTMMNFDEVTDPYDDLD